MKKISVITPSYRDADTLKLHIETFLDQDYENKELILVDDGSKDGTRVIIEKYAKKHPDLIKGIYFRKNMGACIARNEGAKVATGDIYSFLPADSFLPPGLLTAWMQQLEESPECAFVYGGYYFVDNTIKKPTWLGGRVEVPYHSQEFDIRDLKTANYIDGSFPIRKEAFWGAAEKMGLKDGLWNRRVKSLQDWDFWLSVVIEYGATGKYYPGLWFETTMPHKGGLSEDSHNNWLARVKQIQALHGVKPSPICVTSPYNFATHHAKSVAKLLDADFKDFPAMKPHDYEAIYCIGFPVYNPQDIKGYFTTNKFLNQMYALKASGNWDGEYPMSQAKRFIHFIGSDILTLHKLPLDQLYKLKTFLNECHGVFAEFEQTRDELKRLGIDAEVVPFPPRKWFDVTPLPEKKAIAIYLPENNAAFYFRHVFLGAENQKGLVDLMPDVTFHVFGNNLEVKPKKAKNYKIWGHVSSVEDIIKETRAIVRITPHDGLPITVAEWIGAGRNALTTVKMPYADQFDMLSFAKRSKGMGDTTIAVMMQELKEQIYDVLKKPLNEKGAKHYREWLDADKFRQAIYDHLKYEPKRYWEKRAELWDLEARADYVRTKKIKEILGTLQYESVVDVGCGNGRFVDYFEGKRYEGFDISEKLVKICQEKYPGKRFYPSTVEDSPQNMGGYKVDLAFCYTVLEHVKPENIERAASSLKQLAKQILLIEPKPFIPTGDWCYNHDYEKLFNVEKKWPLGDKIVYLINP